MNLWFCFIDRKYEKCEHEICAEGNVVVERELKKAAMRYAKRIDTIAIKQVEEEQRNKLWRQRNKQWRHRNKQWRHRK